MEPQAAAPAPEQGEEGSSDQVMQAMMQVKDVLAQLQQLQGALPPEAMKALQTASSSYEQFLTSAMGVMGGEAPEAAPAGATQEPMAAGNKNAVPVA